MGNSPSERFQSFLLVDEQNEEESIMFSKCSFNIFPMIFYRGGGISQKKRLISFPGDVCWLLKEELFGRSPPPLSLKLVSIFKSFA